MFGLAIATTACRKGTLMEDAGAILPTGSAARSGSGGAAGGDGSGQCTGGGYSTCTPAGVAGPTEGSASGSCTTEGAICALFDCDGVSTGNVTCCEAQWHALAGNACPDLKPGDPYACGNTPTMCTAGQSYCYSSNKDAAPGGAPSCQPLCPAGDCTCFCDNPGGCGFVPADGDCEADWCSCGSALVDNAALALPGGIAVACTYGSGTPGACYPAVAAERACHGSTYTVYCTGRGTTPPPDCTPLPDDVAAPACRTTESHYYCCPI